MAKKKQRVSGDKSLALRIFVLMVAGIMALGVVASAVAVLFV